MAAALRIPVRHASVVILIFAIGAFLLFFIPQGFREIKCLLRTIALCASVLFLVLFTTTNYLSKHFVTYANDGFVYCAFGQYLRDYPRGDQGGLDPIDQLASTFSQTRYGTAAVLASISACTGLNIARSVLPFWLALQLNAFFGLLALARQIGLKRPSQIYYALFYLVSGWSMYALKIANLDNLLFLSILPAFLAYINFLCRSSSLSGYLALAVLASSLIYVYPEGLAVALVIYAPLLLRPAIHNIQRAKTLTPLIGLFLVALFVFPYLGVFGTFLVEQFQATKVMPRPGEGIFPMLTRFDAFLPTSLFGLGRLFRPDVPTGTGPLLTTLILLANVTSLLLTGLLLVSITAGIATTTKKSKPLLVCTGITVCLIVWYFVKERYDYGLFKVIFLSFYAWTGLVFKGLDKIADAMPVFSRHPSLAYSILMLAFLLNLAFESKTSQWFDADISLREYERLQECKSLLNGRKCILVANMPLRDKHLEWAMLFLRGTDLNIPILSPVLQPRANAINSARHKEGVPEFVLSDEQLESPVWRDRSFSMLALPKKPSLLGIDAPNGIDLALGERVLWLDNRLAHLIVWSPGDATAYLVASRIYLGPSCDQTKTNEIILKLNADIRSFLPNTPVRWPLVLRKGINSISLSCLNDWNRRRNPNGDPRVLLGGLLDCQLDNSR